MSMCARSAICVRGRRTLPSTCASTHQNHTRIHSSTRAHIHTHHARVVVRSRRVVDLSSMPLVSLDAQPGVRIPQLHRLVSPCCQGVRSRCGEPHRHDSAVVANKLRRLVRRIPACSHNVFVCILVDKGVCNKRDELLTLLLCTDEGSPQQRANVRDCVAVGAGQHHVCSLTRHC